MGDVETPGAGVTVTIVDGIPPSSNITAPANGATLSGSNYTITGTASDASSGVQSVEVSTDGGNTWNQAVLPSWVIETADGPGDVGWYSSIDIDASGKTHISHQDNTNYTLQYTTNVSGTWQTETVDSSRARAGIHLSPLMLPAKRT